MRKKYEQMSLVDTYKSVEERLENNKPELFLLLDEPPGLGGNYSSSILQRVLPASWPQAELWTGKLSSGIISSTDFSLCGRLPAAQHVAVQPRNAGLLRVRESSGCC